MTSKVCLYKIINEYLAYIMPSEDYKCHEDLIVEEFLKHVKMDPSDINISFTSDEDIEMKYLDETNSRFQDICRMNGRSIGCDPKSRIQIFKYQGDMLLRNDVSRINEFMSLHRPVTEY